MLIQIPDIHDSNIFFMLFYQNVEAKYRSLCDKSLKTVAEPEWAQWGICTPKSKLVDWSS